MAMPLHVTLDGQFETMPWAQIDTVVFDVGNVLLTFSPDAVLKDLFPEDAEKRQLMLDLVFRSPVWCMLDRGILPLDEAAAAIEKAVETVLKDGFRTGDIMADGCKKVGCTEMGDLIAERI